MDYKNIVLYSDMDGTLLNSEGRMSSRNREALQRFMDRGGLFGIATGRNQLNSVCFLEDIRMNIPCILYNGGGLYDFNKEEFIAYHELKKERLSLFLKDCLTGHPRVMIQVFCPHMSYFISSEAYADKKVVTLHQPCRFGRMEELTGEPWIKILLCAEHEELAALEQKLKVYELEKDLQWVYSSEVYLELLPAGVSKGSALDQVRKYIGQEAKIYAVGDYYNDMEMIRAADVGIATRNAVAPLQEIADVITVSNDEHAIADIINRIMDHKRVRTDEAYDKKDGNPSAPDEGTGE